MAAQVLADQFASSEAAVTTLANTFFSQVLQLREAFPPQDDKGLGGPDPPRVQRRGDGTMLLRIPVKGH